MPIGPVVPAAPAAPAPAARAQAQARTDDFDLVYRQHRPMIELTVAWLVKDNHQRLRYRGTERNQHDADNPAKAPLFSRLLGMNRSFGAPVLRPP